MRHNYLRISAVKGTVATLKNCPHSRHLMLINYALVYWPKSMQSSLGTIAT